MEFILIFAIISLGSVAAFIYFLFIKVETIESKEEHILNTGFFQKRIIVRTKHFFRRGKEIQPPVIIEQKTHTKMNPKFALELIPYGTLLSGGGKTLVKKIQKLF